VRHFILEKMDAWMWHIHHPYFYRFWEWVVMPRSWGGRLGFKNWCKWVVR